MQTPTQLGYTIESQKPFATAEKTPASLGFSMPAEWEPHSATWLSWPKNPETFPDAYLPKVEEAYCRMIAALAEGEKVKILVDDEWAEIRIHNMLKNHKVDEGKLQFLSIKSADVWMRDYCPIFLTNKKTGKKAAVRWHFNAWGNKYDDLALDDETGERLATAIAAEQPGTQIFKPGIVMEGGSLEVNGAGTLLTTEQCLLNKNRNPKLKKQEIGQYLKDYMGVKEIIWLTEGIEGDDTDGHIDDFARFVGKKTAIVAQEKKQNDPNHAPLESAASILSEYGLEVLRLPMPSPLIDKEENRRLPASYANYYIGNSCVLLPVFGDKSDKEVISTLQSLFPKREIVPIMAKELVYGYGGIHCVTQQQPK